MNAAGTADARTLILSHAEVERLLPMADCIELMADALGALARGEAQLPLRTVVPLPGGRNALASMPAALGACIGAKVITVFPDNQASPYESHIGVVLCFDGESGRLLAIADASSITAIRTAAVSGLATRLLARVSASTLAILGSGVQAMRHLEAMRCVRPIEVVRVWSRNAHSAGAFCERARARFGCDVRPAETAEAAVRGADVVCTTTSSSDPVLRGEWLAAGAHVNAVGACVPSARELDSEAVRKARLYVDRRESVMAESGDFLVPRTQGLIDDAHIVGELGEVVIGRVPGRTAPAEVTLFKSLGIAVEDVASARLLFERARAAGGGTWLEIGGLR